MPPTFRLRSLTRTNAVDLRARSNVVDITAAITASAVKPLESPTFTGSMPEFSVAPSTGLLHQTRRSTSTANSTDISPEAQSLIERAFPPAEFVLPAGVNGSTVLDVYYTQLRLPLRMPLATIIGSASAQARAILQRDRSSMTDDQLVALVLEPLSAIGYETVAAAQLAIRSAPEKSFADATTYLEQIASLAQTLILVRHINPHQALQILKQLFDVERPTSTDSQLDASDRFHSLRQATRQYLRNPDGVALETAMATAPALSELNLAAFSLIRLTERLQIRAEVDGHGNISPESVSRIKQNLLQFLQQQIPFFVAKFRAHPTQSLWNEIRAIGAACDILLGSLPANPTGFWERATLDGPLQRLVLSLNSRKHFEEFAEPPK